MLTLAGKNKSKPYAMAQAYIKVVHTQQHSTYSVHKTHPDEVSHTPSSSTAIIA